MKRSFARLCLVAVIACAARAEVHGRDRSEEHGPTTTAVGCLEQGSRPQSFVLRVTEAQAAGSRIALAGPGRTPVGQYVGHTVQVSGVIARQKGNGGRDGGATPRMTVRQIRSIAASCSGSQPAAGSPASSPGATNPATGTPTATPGSGTPTTGTPGSTTPATTTPGSGTTNTSTNTNTSGTSGQTGVSGDAMLDGLINFNIQQLMLSVQFVTNVQDTVINVTDVLNDFQIQLLIQALNSNPVASLNATELSFALQQAGMLAPGETVVGAEPAAVRDNKALTQALQEQGVLKPGEKVVGVKGPRVYKMKH